jgi:hypothetical protein
MKKWLLSSIVILFLLSGCSLPDNPGMPTWDTTLNLYVLNDSYDLLELADEDSSIVAMEITPGDSVLAIYQEETSEQDLMIGDTEPLTESEYAEIGEIELPDLQPVEGIMTFGEFAEAAGLAIPGQGQTVPEIPAFNFDGISQELATVSEIQWVEIMSGGFELEITNNMIIGLGNFQNSEYLTLRLVYDNNGVPENVISDIILTDRNLESGESYVILVDLETAVLYRDMQLLIGGGSRGTNGASAVIELNDELVTNIEFWEGMTASAAEARIAEQTIQDTVSMAFDNDYLLYEAEVADNPDYQLELHVENGIDLELLLHIEIPTLYIDSEEHYAADFLIPRSLDGGIFDFVLPMSGARLGDGTELMEFIEIHTTAHIDSTLDDDFRIISFENSYLVEAELTELEFGFIRGVIQPQDQDVIIEEIDLDVEYPEIQEGGQFTFVGESEIRIDVDTGSSQIPGVLVIEARGYDQDGLMVELVDIVSGETPQVAIPAESSFSIVFSSDQYNINELLSVLPVRIEFEVLVTVGDGVSEVIYQQGDILMADITLESTLALAADTWVIPREDGELMVQEEEIELDDNEYDAFQSGSLKLVYTNSTGLSVALDILLSDSEANVIGELYNFENPDLNKVDIITIPALEETLEGESKELTIELDQTDLDYFMSDYTYVGSRLHLVSAGTQALSGVVDLLGQAEIVIRISNDLVEDGEE